jgi:hypothetical protein
MCAICTVSDVDECRRLWKQLLPAEMVSDLWEVRECFHSQYRHSPRFIVAEEGGNVVGFLPLCWNEETGQYNYFPGETWEGKTWLEQNRIIATGRHVLEAMLASLDGPCHLRYLRNDDRWREADKRVDEVGYLFIPETYGCDVDRYFEVFSHKTAKKLRKELAAWERRSVSWRFDQTSDFEILCEMNRRRFGPMSYFHDERFLESFCSLLRLLEERGWLRLVTVIVDGEPAAVDMGSLYSGMLTMLAGGASQEFPGIAKLINMHHITYACEQKLDSVDFLCGDFNWKTLFHLTPVPLYVIEKGAEPVSERGISIFGHIPRAAINQTLRGAPYA